MNERKFECLGSCKFGRIRLLGALRNEHEDVWEIDTFKGLYLVGRPKMGECL